MKILRVSIEYGDINALYRYLYGKVLKCTVKGRWFYILVNENKLEPLKAHIEAWAKSNNDTVLYKPQVSAKHKPKSFMEEPRLQKTIEQRRAATKAVFDALNKINPTKYNNYTQWIKNRPFKTI